VTEEGYKEVNIALNSRVTRLGEQRMGLKQHLRCVLEAGNVLGEQHQILIKSRASLGPIKTRNICLYISNLPNLSKSY
jgi:hypothetical protein